MLLSKITNNNTCFHTKQMMLLKKTIILSIKNIIVKNQQYYVYIITNFTNSVLYTGVTNDLYRRTYEHKHSLIKGFTSKYRVTKLVYFEMFDYIDLAINREKQIKGYSRLKKENLVNKNNSNWIDLYQNNKIIDPTKLK
jgi:putative endonuclease